MASAWVFQENADVASMGADLAHWHCSFYDPEGKRRKKTFGPGKRGKRLADEFRKKTEAELMTGTFEMRSEIMWDEFMKEYVSRVLDGLAFETRRAALNSLAHFQRIMKPHRVFAIGAGHIAEFTSRRRPEVDPRKKKPISPATVNRDLRHVKAALSMAVEWGYLQTLPRFRMERVAEKLPTFIPPAHFKLLYLAAEDATKPSGLSFPAANWWRGFMMFAYMTGWRLMQILDLKREQINLDVGTVHSLAAHNKGNRDVLIKLHPVVVEHLRDMPSFDPLLFPWPHGPRQLYDEFETLQKAAGVRPENSSKRRYGFHDLRRAFATMNAGRMTPEALQELMQHKALATTMSYINIARQLDVAVENLFVPDVGGKEKVGGA